MGSWRVLPAVSKLFLVCKTWFTSLTLNNKFGQIFTQKTKKCASFSSHAQNYEYYGDLSLNKIFFLNETSNYSSWGEQTYHLVQKLVRKFSSQTAEFWQKYTLLKYIFCNKIQATLILYAAIPMVCIEFNFNNKLLSARLYKNKEFMKPVWVISTRCYIGINVVLCPLNQRQKDQSTIRSLVAGAATCTEPSG